MRAQPGREIGTCPERAWITRRQFLRGGAAVGLSAAALGPWGCGVVPEDVDAEPLDVRGAATDLQPVDMRRGGVGQRRRAAQVRGATDLVVQPVLMYSIPRRRKGRSWRNWGGVQTEEAAGQEALRIGKELDGLCERADFGMRALPVAKVTRPQQVGGLKDAGADAVVLYAAGGWMDSFNALIGLGKPLIVFLRRHSGPYYLWDEIVHARLLRGHKDQLTHPGLGVNDVVVDDHDGLIWRLRALYGLSNTLGRRIVCVGGPSGWSTGGAPERARERFRLDTVSVPIRELNAMIQAGRKDEALMDRCRRDAGGYLSAAGVTLKTSREAVTEAFLLKKLFGDLMTNHKAHAITTNACMGSYAGIMPCLTLGLINDGGYMAYCESDFVVIPSGILMHFICGKPTYLCNPTYPYKGRMVFAHCAAPRRMDGSNLEAVDVVTHYESDHGAASHVKFRTGQLLTILKPDFEGKHWLAFTATVVGTPELPTCRAQIEVQLKPDTQEVLRNLRGFHCMLAYGDYTREVGYAASKVGIAVQTLS